MPFLFSWPSTTSWSGEGFWERWGLNSGEAEKDDDGALSTSRRVCGNSKVKCVDSVGMAFRKQVCYVGRSVFNKVGPL